MCLLILSKLNPFEFTCKSNEMNKLFDSLLCF